MAAVHMAVASGYDAAAAAHTVPLAGASGRILATDLLAPLNLPPFDNSQMDGFAVCVADLERSTNLLVSGARAAGAGPASHVPGTAHAVMTGAVIPDGADAVIPVEHVDPPTFATDRVSLSPDVVAATTSGRFIRGAGSDVARGAVALPAGTVLGPAAVGACAALGLAPDTPVAVRSGPSVLVVTGGDEIMEPGTPLREGTVYDANGPLLTSWLLDAGASAVHAVRVTDDPAELARRLRRSVREHAPHLIVTSGGVSAGAFEVVRTVLEPDPRMWFGHVAMQPGGPQGCGQHLGVPVVCLPGNPVSTWVSCEVFVRPALAAVWGCTGSPLWAGAILAEPVACLPGRTQMRRGVLGATQDGEPSVRCEGAASSHLLMSAARANVLLRIPAGTDELPTGTRVRVLPLPGGVAQTGDGQ